MAIAVFHAARPTFGVGPEPEEFVHVADVDVSDEDYPEVFRLTNTIDHYWWENAQVTSTFAGEGCRSTSVGDRIRLSDGRVLRCASFGWEEVETSPATP
jgi:hypothetical protein